MLLDPFFSPDPRAQKMIQSPKKSGYKLMHKNSDITLQKMVPDQCFYPDPMNQKNMNPDPSWFLY